MQRKNLDKFGKNIFQSFPLARTARITLFDIVNVDLSVTGRLFLVNQHHSFQFYPKPTHFTPVDPKHWDFRVG